MPRQQHQQQSDRAGGKDQKQQMKREEHKTHSSFYRVNTTASLPLSFVSCVPIVAHYYQPPAFVCSSCSCSNLPLPPVTTHQPSGPQTQARNNEQVATVAWSGRFDHRSPTPRRASAGGSNHSRHRSNQPPQFLDWLSACRAPPTGKETKQEPHQSPLLSWHAIAAGSMRRCWPL